MARRMDRYNSIDKSDNEEYSRSNKNQDLYNNIGSNAKYTNYTDVSKIDAIYLDDVKKNEHTREGYKTIKEYAGVEKPRVKKELEDFNYLYQDMEDRVYDINSAIKKAKENRKENDEKEGKRKLKNTNYNILASLNPEKLEDYHKEKVEEKIEKLEKNKNKNDNELRELIDTITSKTLAGEISKQTSVDLLSDLMATNVMDKVDPAQENKNKNEKDKHKEKDTLGKKEIEQLESAQKEYKEPTNELMKDMDKSFYTKSMDLSDKDFTFDDEEIKKVPVVVKLLLILVLIALIAVGTYFVMNNIK